MVIFNVKRSMGINRRNKESRRKEKEEMPPDEKRNIENHRMNRND